MAVTTVFPMTATAGISSWDPASVGGRYANAWVFSWGSTGYALCRADGLTGIPGEAIIHSARLRWRMFDSDERRYERTGDSSLTLRANRITSGWTRSSVTYATRPTYTHIDAPSVTDAFYSPGEWTPWWDVTAHVAAIVAGDVPNHGWCMECVSGSGGVAFENYSYLPPFPPSAEIEVTYTAPASVDIEWPDGTWSAPSIILDRISGFELIAAWGSEGGEPVSSVSVEVFDQAGNRLAEFARRYNVLTANQRSVEYGTDGFLAVSGATIAQDATRSWHGSKSLKVTPSASAGSGVRIPYAYPSVGAEYSGRVMVSGVFGTELDMQVLAVSGAGVVGDARTTRQVLLGNTSVTGCAQVPERTWTEFSAEGVAVGLDVAAIRMEVLSVTPTAPAFYIDGCMLTEGPEVASWTSSGATRFVVPPGLLEYGRPHSWRVQAENEAGASGWTPLAWFRPDLSAPADLTAESISDRGIIALDWTGHPAEGLAGYIVERRLAASTESEWEETSLDLVLESAYDDDAAAARQRYDYRVRAVAGNGYRSPPSMPAADASVSWPLTTWWLGSLVLADLVSGLGLESVWDVSLRQTFGQRYPSVQTMGPDAGDTGREIALALETDDQSAYDAVLSQLRRGVVSLRTPATDGDIGQVYRVHVSGRVRAQRLPGRARAQYSMLIPLREVAQ